MAGDPKHQVGPPPPYPGPPPGHPAYGYPPPPPYGHPYHPGGPAYYYPPPPPADDGRLILLRFVYLVTAAFLLICALSLVAWIIMRPAAPEFSVVAASVSASTIDITLSVRNPNRKVGIYYDQVAAAVHSASGADAAEGILLLPPFYQEKENTTEVWIRTGTAEGAVGGPRVSGGPVALGVRLTVEVRFSASMWMSFVIRVYCDDITMGYASPTAAVGSMVGPPSRCLVS